MNGLRVVDLCVDRAGSVAGMLLGDLGACVVRPEVTGGAHSRPDPTSDADPVCWDRGKRRLAVDVLTADALSSILVEADVVLVDHLPAGAGSDIGAPQLCATHPRLVIGWFPPYGSRGNHGSLPADPLLLSGISGYAQHQPATVAVPIAPVVPVTQYVQGAMGAAAVVAAVLERAASAAGQIVTVTGLHAVAALEGAIMTDALDQPQVFRPGRDVRAGPSFRAYECADGKWLFLAALVGPLFIMALDAIDLMEVMVLPGVDGEFTNLFRPGIGPEVSTHLERRFAEQPRQHWLGLLQAAGVPVAPVQTRAEWTASEAFEAIGGRHAVTYPGIGEVLLPAAPWNLSATPLPAPVPPRPVGPADAWTPGPSWHPAADGQPPVSPLAGVRIVDISTFVAAPFGPSILAQWGADVVKVESLDGDPYRVYSVSYAATNQAKRSVAIDLRRPEGSAALRALLEQADVLVENFGNDSLRRLGLDPDAIRSANPRLIHVNVSTFGDHGPMAGRPGFDPVVQAMSGLMDAVGNDEVPINTTTALHDIATAALLALGTLAALAHRLRTGEGQRLGLSLASSSLLLQCAELTDFTGRPPTGRGGPDFVGASATVRYYEASDGWVGIAARRPDDVARLVEALGVDPGAAEDDGALARVIGERVAGETMAEVVGRLRAAGVPVGPVIDNAHWREDPHLVANEFSHVVNVEAIGRCQVLHRLAEWSRSVPVDDPQIDAVGASGDQILARIGLDAEAVAALRRDGVIR